MSFSDHFSIRNIPYGIATSSSHPQKAVVTRVHDHVFFLSDLPIQISEEIRQAIAQTTLNALASIPKDKLRQLRSTIQGLLADEQTVTKHGVPVSQVELHLPIEVRGFTDFSCSKQHLLNAGEASTGRRILPPASVHYPIGYGGRASSVRVSGTPVVRPYGVYQQDGGEGVTFGPSQGVDFELEMAAVIGKPSKFGDRVAVKDADEHIFGLVLLNDWSARDVQKLEMMPLGPNNSKSFHTSISPWVVTLEALEPFEAPPPPKETPVPAFLQDPKEKSSYDISLAVDVIRDGVSTTVCKAQLGWMYWTFRDLVAQQTINGCNVNTGDLLATGTVSGTEDHEHGCLLETTMGGRKSVKLSDGQELVWLKDGDEARLTGFCGDGVGFGDVTGVITPATPFEGLEAVV
ncbi:hypothetical protein diail_5029 [Diaporthe ilicicola]|nr:hypothetical protein diail_5029 [Diaporthe ilicicola]